MTKKFSANEMFKAVLVGFLATQLISWIISAFTDIPILKGGPMLILFLVIVVITTLYTLGQNITQVNIKKEGILILLVFGIILALIMFLPDYLPQIFSSQSIELGETIKETMISVIKLSSGGVVGWNSNSKLNQGGKIYE